MITITNNQIRELSRTNARGVPFARFSPEQHRVNLDCDVALDAPMGLRRNQARARCAEILNARKVQP